MGGGGESQPQTVSNTTTQKADPWAKQQPYLEDIFSEASNLYKNASPYYYPQSSVAGFSPEELAAQGSTVQYAQGGARDLINQGLSGQSFLLGDVLRADSNPYMADYAKGAISPVWDALTRIGMPTVDSGAVASGQYGGSRQGVAQGLALSDATRQSFDTTSKMYSDMYGQNLDAMQRAVLGNEAVVKGGTLPDQLLATVGGDRRAMEQALIDDAMARWEWEQSLPSAKLAQYQGAVQGTYGGAGTSTSTGEAPGVPQPSTGQKALSAGLAGLGTYGALAGAGLTAVAPWAAGAIALGSLLLS